MAPPSNRRYQHEPVYLLRGLKQLHLEFTPSADRTLTPCRN